MRTLLMGAVLLLGGLGLGLGAGCEGVKRAPATAAACEKLGDRCQLPEAGPLGICNSTPCRPGQAPPCLKCIPQH